MQGELLCLPVSILISPASPLISGRVRMHLLFERDRRTMSPHRAGFFLAAGSVVLVFLRHRLFTLSRDVAPFVPVIRIVVRVVVAHRLFPQWLSMCDEYIRLVVCFGKHDYSPLPLWNLLWRSRSGLPAHSLNDHFCGAMLWKFSVDIDPLPTAGS